MIECTGAGKLVLEAMQGKAADRIVCLTGVSSGGRTLEIDPGSLDRSMVLANDVIFGSVNANRRHYEAGAEALARADPAWLGRLITRRVPLDRWQEALKHIPGDVKAIITLRD